MATETRTVSLRLPDDMAEYAEKVGGGSINQGVKDIIIKLQEMEKVSDISLKGIFTSGEWKAFADSLNGTMVLDSFRYYNDALIAHMEDSDKYENICEKWGIDLKEVCEKILKLHPCQTEALYRRVETFWEDSTSIDLNKWSEF